MGYDDQRGRVLQEIILMPLAALISSSDGALTHDLGVVDGWQRSMCTFVISVFGNRSLNGGLLGNVPCHKEVPLVCHV